MSSTTSSASPSPSFLVRLRARARRSGVEVDLPEDHWHAGDPRVVDGTLALVAGEVPSPRSPVDRRRLSAVREVDVRDGAVLDLRPKALGTGMLPVTLPTAATRAPEPPAAAPGPTTGECSETSTWLG